MLGKIRIEYFSSDVHKIVSFRSGLGKNVSEDIGISWCISQLYLKPSQKTFVSSRRNSPSGKRIIIIPGSERMIPKTQLAKQMIAMASNYGDREMLRLRPSQWQSFCTYHFTDFIGARGIVPSGISPRHLRNTKRNGIIPIPLFLTLGK